MNRKKISSFLISVLAAGLLLALLLGFVGTFESQAAENFPTQPDRALAVPVTVITVTSGTDPDTNNSSTCISASPCTLRRAVIQARNLPANQKPVLIAFDIPADAAEGYVASLQIWKIQFTGISTDQAAL